jgi:hypothetical protein
MKKLPCALICSLVFSAPMALAHTRGPQEISPKPYAEILRFYDDLNDVIAFSSYPERVELTKYLAEKELPEKFRHNHRLTKVFTLMKKIEAEIISKDPKIVIWTKPPSGHIYYSGLIEIKRIRPEGAKVKVDVVVYHVKPDINNELIARYEAAEGDDHKIPKEEEMLGLVKPASYQNEEVHTWVRINGEWKKDEAELVSLK